MQLCNGVEGECGYGYGKEMDTKADTHMGKSDTCVGAHRSLAAVEQEPKSGPCA